ncbi:MAG: DNA repair nucleotidyltransferase [Alteromonas sp.]|jgi:protein ImuB|uniref:Y-family DNA polymerase n=1 Tax=unclassified Alteromonas TaxID=2614992 RepID=UPI000904328F|nr:MULTISPECIES: DNA polymerase Y family protein [unclassified Alteromonas]APE04391.1 DNA repair nucleotidyltransferase [Alteromonas sp. RW2A1]AUC86796.1 DNA polymerase Y family protein [Alteromonas sp. MB-3u-76]MAI65058.1 DNA repair nucleotidyltransferase [Alteromonas sp.]
MLWAYLYFYQITLDTHQESGLSPVDSAHLEIPSSPVIVYCEKTNHVVQRNHAALQQGIEIGHGLAQAAALCPHVCIIPFNVDNEHLTLTQLAHRLYPLASDIVLDTHNTLAVRLDNLVHYYGGHKALWNTLTHELSQSNVHYHFATAWSIEAAKVLALKGIDRYYDNHDDIRQSLSHCPLSLTALNKKTKEALTRVGIHRVHQLLAMPVHELGRRFDNNTITYLTALRGEVFPRVKLFRPAEHFEHFALLPFDVENTQHLIPFMEKLLEYLAHYLRARNLQTSTLSFHIAFRDQPSNHLEIKSALPQSTSDSWLSLLKLRIENLVLPEPAVSLTLRCDNFEAIDDNNGDFFSNRFNDVAQKQLIGRLNAKLGEKCTFKPSISNTHQFEYMSNGPRLTKETVFSSDIVPTFLFEAPKPLTQSTQVCFGPVRLHSEWWHDAPHKRDYFIAQTRQGVRMLIFKDEASKWWAQGLFS